MQAFYIFVVSLLLTLNSRGEASGSVFFIDGFNNQYIRPRSSSEALPMSLSDISATVSALLGFAPPSTLTADGSSKLNKILKPNPFERPRASFLLEIAGADATLVESHSYLGNAIKGSISSDSYRADIELPESDVAVVSVNEPSSDVTDKDMNEFASWLGGSYVASSAEPLTGSLSIPLAGVANVEFHLAKEAERKFALNLLNLYQNIRRAVNLHEDLSHGIERPAELTVGRFDGIDALAQENGKGMAKQGMDVLLATVSKLFDLLKTSQKGKIVGVIVLDERVNQGESANLLSVESSSRSSARSMVEVEGIPSAAIIAQIILVRLTLAWLTGIILLIATILGVYFLMSMPLTKDTLLYSNVKLD